MKKHPPTVGLVGPCTSGKSLLRERLNKHGFIVRHIAQEHSFVPDMWKRVARPDVLIYLEVSYPVTLKRRNWSWQESEYREQLRRLAHARAHADLCVSTDRLSPDEVEVKILEFLAEFFAVPRRGSQPQR